MVTGFLNETEIAENGEDFDFSWTTSDGFFVGVTSKELERIKAIHGQQFEEFGRLARRQYLVAFRMSN